VSHIDRSVAEGTPDPAASDPALAPNEPASSETPAVAAEPPMVVSDVTPDGGSKNAAPGGFPTHRMPSARTGHRPMPGISSPSDAAARSAAARSAAAGLLRDAVPPTTAPDPTRTPNGADPVEPTAPDAPVRHPKETEAADDRRTLAPRQDNGERSTALALFFEPDPAPAAETAVDALWPASVTRVPTGHRGDTAYSVTPGKRPKPPRSPAVGLIGLLLFTFIATFFAWFSAGPLALSLGHSHHGVATVANCPVAGIDKRCARFTADGGEFTATVTLLGPGAQAAEGTTIPAEMVSRTNTIAYSGDASSLYLRWIPGLVIVVLCGFGIAWITGTYRLSGRRARAAALVASIGGPILIAAGMLAVTW
jgi:hypothetical protein